MATVATKIKEVEAYIQTTSKRSERDRLADVKTISGVFTGAYAEHPFTKAPVPIWIGDYVLAGYGTGAVMSDFSSTGSAAFSKLVVDLFKLVTPLFKLVTLFLGLD